MFGRSCGPAWLPNLVIIAAVGETVEDVGKTVAWRERAGGHRRHVPVPEQIEPRFVSHFMQSSTFNRQKEQFDGEGKIKRLSGDGLGRILVPVLPREEQDRTSRPSGEVRGARERPQRWASGGVGCAPEAV